MAERLVLPPPGESHDRVTGVPAETAVKHYLRAHAADLADAARQLPGLTVARGRRPRPDRSPSPAATRACSTSCARSASWPGMGWEVTYDAGQRRVRVRRPRRRRPLGIGVLRLRVPDARALDRARLGPRVQDPRRGRGPGRGRRPRRRGPLVRAPSRPGSTAARRSSTRATSRPGRRSSSSSAATRTSPRPAPRRASRPASTSTAPSATASTGTSATSSSCATPSAGSATPARIVEVEKAFERSAAAPTVTATLGAPFPTLRSQAAAASSPATADGAVSTATGGGAPVGSIVLWPAPAPPADWLACDGALAPALGVPRAVRRPRHDVRRRRRQPLLPARLPRPRPGRPQGDRRRLRHPGRDAGREDRDPVGARGHPAVRAHRHPARRPTRTTP